MHVSFFGKSLVQCKRLVKGVTGLSLLGYLEIIPHELLIVRVDTILYDAFCAFGRLLAAKVGDTLFSDENLYAVFVMVHMRAHRNDSAYLASLGN